MDKLQRNERIAALVKILTDSPGKIFTLGHFTEMFGSAKSTISEDIDIVSNILARLDLGTIETIPGASGGVRLVPSLNRSKIQGILKNLCEELAKKERILPGGYIYMLDVIYNPETISEIGAIFAGQFFSKGIDYVVTVETKGIPLAFITAKYLNVPLVIVRHYNEATDGASVNINYVSGSSKKIQTMVLSLKAIKKNSKLLFIDDFMKGGGTAKGIVELAKEFECEVAGIGVLIETAEPQKKLVENYFSLLTLNEVNEENSIIDISPNNTIC
ncbi:MAG: pur operon repressor [Clostridia bacterium]|nr:pur operon repressor [Clostridia bacterium]